MGPYVFEGRIPLNADWLVSRFLPWRTKYAGLKPHNAELDDPAINIYPLRLEAIRQWREGLVPLWNPYIFCGMPLLADNASFPLDPLNVLAILFGMPDGYALSILAQLVLTGWGAYLFLRSLGVSGLGSFVGASVWMLNGTFAVWLEYGFWIGAVCWVPWALWLYERSRERWGFAAFGGFILGLSFLGGQLQIALYVLTFAAGYAIVDGIVCRRARAPLLFLGLAVLTSAAQVLPTIELAARSPRPPQRYTETNALKPVELLSFLAPDIFGDPVHGYVGAQLVGISFVGRHGGYVGLLPLVSSLAALRRRDWRRLYFAAVGFGTVAFLLLLNTAFQKWLVGVLPGFGTVHARRMIIFFVMGASCLCGFGWDALDPRRTAKVLCLLALCPIVILVLIVAGYTSALSPMAALRALGVLILASVLLRFLGRASLGEDEPPAAGVRLCAGALALLVGFDLYLGGWDYNPFCDRRLVYPESEALAWLKANHPLARVSGAEPRNADPWKGDILPPDTGLVYRLFDVRGKESLYPRAYGALMEEIDGRGIPFLVSVHLWTGAHRSPVMDQLAVEFVVSGNELNLPALREVHRSDLIVYRNVQALPRWGVRYPLSDGAEEAPVTEGQSRLLHYGATDVILRIHGWPESDNGRRLRLLVAETFAPGWRSFVNGNEAPIAFRERTLQRIVLAEDGELRMAYEPRCFRYGLALSLLALWAAVGLTWLAGGSTCTLPAVSPAVR